MAPTSDLGRIIAGILMCVGDWIHRHVDWNDRNVFPEIVNKKADCETKIETPAPV